MSSWRPLPRQSWWKRLLPRWTHGPLRVLGIFAVLGFCGGFAFVLFYAMLASRFDVGEVAILPEATRFLDREGVAMESTVGGGGRKVTRSELPDFLVKALRAREDVRFFEHSGVDLKGLARAMARNLKDREFSEGASTISMQLARNTFDIRAKSLHRKFLEIALTWRIEGEYEKNELLTCYLNRIYFGSGAYGIEQAARTYFGKSTAELSDGECALIVGIIRGPHIFSPLRNLDAALAQRDQTLARMVSLGWISGSRSDEIRATPIVLATDSDSSGIQPSFALRAARAELDRILDRLQIREDGLQVVTTLDRSWQARLEAELEAAMDALEKSKDWRHPTYDVSSAAAGPPEYLQCAAVTTQIGTGEILAWIGGRDFSQSGFDHNRSRRDLGGAIEPYVAAAAAERGKLVLPGRPVQTGRQLGAGETARLIQRCGLELSGPFLETEDLFRGSAAVTTQDLSTALSVLGGEGLRPTPSFIREIRDASGKSVYRHTPRTTRAITANAADESLRVFKKRSGIRAFSGTSAARSDAWTLRIGPTGATAIWFGLDQPAPIAPASQINSFLESLISNLGND